MNRGGEKVAVTEYEYYTDWSSQRIDSDRFDDPSYANPRVRARRLPRDATLVVLALRV